WAPTREWPAPGTRGRGMGDGVEPAAAEPGAPGSVAAGGVATGGVSREVIRVALVGDQQLVRAGFRMVIDSQPDLEVVVEAGDGLEALRRIAAVDVDVVLMDVRMPHLDGLAATERLTGSRGERDVPRVVVLTTFDLDEYVLAAIRAGA